MRLNHLLENGQLRTLKTDEGRVVKSFSDFSPTVLKSGSVSDMVVYLLF